ncbi:Polyketide synthase PksM [Paenibacillus plantiphilus]|uniref:Polyketide synthase PksM n=1 Tax=Paenibacillus plantiphilus TaxID=2905650 RepID=A0ABN8G3E8_9BACL|nr:type I polyketide synthase [Paenibacillus plantiphilus]CAH1195691.1 Polyketide synthase PksM [Paenibacillus plantiphilus]
MVKFNDIKLNRRKEAAPAPQSAAEPTVSDKDVAVIGISLKFPQADTPETFWRQLREGVDSIGAFPETRREDAEDMKRLLKGVQQEAAFENAAYLDEVDKFDYSFFRISPNEASLMDPSQRLFLETVWGAIEDGGYGGKKLSGSRTGVFVGYGSDPEYKQLVTAVDPELLAGAHTGNTNPIIASRIAYLLDLKGPNMIVDTTCSSSLLAIHLACQSLRNEECELAIAGGVELHLMPIRQTSIGVEAGDGRAKSFDERADGTGTGEGVAAVLLKPLAKAVADGDAIYAIIKGSAVNHDGTSIGLTAPNALAQEDVIANAWKDARVEAESITYIEAHGTGTKLGDPIEIEGMQRAFRRFTDKRHFCAVGSVKTNIGHLDHSAGMAGFIKAALALQHRELPPSLHFKEPNRKIDFVKSPVYVNDRLAPWVSTRYPRRCGVSSFGLSGTNCHVVLQEAPDKAVSQPSQSAAGFGSQVLTLSARDEQALKRLIASYRERISWADAAAMRDICFTANTGRGQYSHRIAFVFHSQDELLQQLLAAEQSASLASLQTDGVGYGAHRIVSANQPTKEAGELTEHVVQSITQMANGMLDGYVNEQGQNSGLLSDVCRFYTEGANMDWERIYRNETRQRVHLPIYPFERTRCWIDTRARGSAAALHPLVDKQVAVTLDTEIYATSYDVSRHWVLSEHKIMNDSVLVGTAYLEMVLQVCSQSHPDVIVAFKDVQFHAPLTVKEGEQADVQLVIRKASGNYLFTVESTAGEGSFTKHVQGSFELKPREGHRAHHDESIDSIIRRLESGHMVPDLERYNDTSVFEFGPRWNNIREMYVGDSELLSHIRIPDAFKGELSQFTLYPSMMDNALTTMPLIAKAIEVNSLTDDSIYLPFSYGSLTVYRQLPPEFYSYVRLKSPITETTELISYDIMLISPGGAVIADIRGYSLKKARKNRLGAQGAGSNHLFHKMEWVQQEITAVEAARTSVSGSVLMIGRPDARTEQLAAALRKQAYSVIVAHPADQFQQTGEQSYQFALSRDGMERLMQAVKGEPISRIIHMLTFGEAGHSHSDGTDAADAKLANGVNSVFELVKSLLAHNYRQSIDIAILTSHAYSVTGEESFVVPEYAALSGLSRVVGQEYPNLKSRTIDVAFDTSLDLLLKELLSPGEAAERVAYRGGSRWIEQFQELSLQVDESGGEVIAPASTYVITGGTGGIGLEIARYLALRAQVNIVLLGRSALPPRQQWSTIVNDGSEFKLCRTIRAIEEIEASGSSVLFIRTDAGNRDSLSNALNGIREKYGRIHGIIHSAGLPANGYIIKKELDDFHAVLAPKVNGALLLDELTEGDNPDFFVVFSSNTTLMGVPGQSDYTAANSFLDAFASYRNRKGKRTITINWPAWKETGMAVDHGTNGDNLLKALPTAQAIHAFHQILHTPSAERIIVGELNAAGSFNGYSLSDVPINFSEEIRRKFKLNRKDSAVRAADGKKAAAALRKGKEGLSSAVDWETAISAIWRVVLGFEEINVYDSFFDIGGDSIMITKVHSLMEEQFPGRVSIADLFTYTSVSDMAQYMVSLDAGNEAAADSEIVELEDIDLGIESLLDALEQGEVSVESAMESFMKLGGMR